MRPGVDAAARVLHRALEQQVRWWSSGAAWSWKVRKSCIWSPLAEVDGEQVAAGAPPDEAGVGADPGVVAAEGHAWPSSDVASRSPGATWLADLPDAGAELVDRRGSGRRAACSACELERRARPGRGPTSSDDEALDDGDLAVRRRPRRPARGNVAAPSPSTTVGRSTHRARRRALPAGIRSTHVASARVAAFSSANEVVAGGSSSATSAPAVDDHVGRHRRRRRPSARCRREAVEVELADAAVAPDLLVGRRERAAAARSAAATRRSRSGGLGGAARAASTENEGTGQPTAGGPRASALERDGFD